MLGFIVYVHHWSSSIAGFIARALVPGRRSHVGRRKHPAWHHRLVRRWVPRVRADANHDVRRRFQASGFIALPPVRSSARDRLGWSTRSITGAGTTTCSESITRVTNLGRNGLAICASWASSSCAHLSSD